MDVQTTTLRRDNYERHPGPVTTAEAIRTTLLNRVSWSAVFAGIVMAFAAQLILNLIGLSIGAATMLGASPTAAGFSLSAAIWAGITGIIAAFIGGYTAGRLAGEPEMTTAGWHGLISWGASILLVALLMTTAASGLFAGPLEAMVNQTGLAVTSTTGAATAGAAGETAAAAAATPIAMDSGSIAVAAIVSAVALILGALAAWYGGCAGTVKVATLRNEDSRKVVH